MQDSQLSEYFDRVLATEQELSPAVAAIKTLLAFIEQQAFGTVAEMRERVVKAIDTLTKTDSSAISIKSGCEMLLRFITLTALDAGVRCIFFIQMYRLGRRCVTYQMTMNDQSMLRLGSNPTFCCALAKWVETRLKCIRCLDVD
jgi:translation initiation factor 2B subunit (eIF-2B alpha/beta/delta family)